MMSSFPENIPAIISIIAKVRPTKTLDIGSGFGKFGLITREILISMDTEDGLDEPLDLLTVDCVESSPYFWEQPAHRGIYNGHCHQDVHTMNPDQINGYDLILLIDVIEHWTKGQTVAFMKRIAAPVLISTPREVYMYERRIYAADPHQTQWTVDEVKALSSNGAYEDYSTEKSHIVLLNTCL